MSTVSRAAHGGALLARRDMRLLACGIAALGAGLVVGGASAWLIAGATFVASHAAVSRLEPGDVRRRRSRALADAPVAADLLAACLAGGSEASTAVAAIGPALGGDVGAALSGVAAAVSLGSPPLTAWRSAAQRAPALQPLARAVARSASTGAPLASVIALLADEQRADRVLAGELAARQVGVRVAGPLGLCFLPAFVLLGVVPLVAGIATELLTP